MAIKPTLGWILSGPVESVGHECAVNLITTHVLRADDGVTNKMLDDTMRSFWTLELMGIQVEDTEPSLDDQFMNSIKMVNGCYEVSLPWQEGHDLLPTNCDLSRRRLTGLLWQLKQSPEVLKEYDSIIRTQLQDGIIELVKEAAPCAGVVHYLPHHGVICRDKDTTKVRVVHDASSK